MASNDPSILDLISQYPIFSSILENVHFWDLIQLSRTSTTIRSACHGFVEDLSDNGSEYVSDTGIRVALNIGCQNTSTWRLYKNLTRKNCSESDHTKGREGLGCRLCSRPVCFACVVKHSFGKEENTFLLRGRTLCEECFRAGNPHSEHILVQGSVNVRTIYGRSRLCHCTSQDGILCSDCKRKQNEESSHKYKRLCAGNGCHNPINTNSVTVRVCLWCDSILPLAVLKQQDGVSPLFKIRHASGIHTQGYRSGSAPHEYSEQAMMEASFGELITIPTVELVSVQISTTILEPDNDWPPPDDALPAYSLYPVQTGNSSRPPLQQV